MEQHKNKKRMFTEWIKIKTKLDVCFKVLKHFYDAIRQYLMNACLAQKPIQHKNRLYT